MREQNIPMPMRSLMLMPKTFLFVSLILFSGLSSIQAQENYEEKWEKVKGYEEKALPSAALEVCDSIFQMARQEGNIPQATKALLRKIKLSADFQENPYLHYAETLDSLVSATEGIEQAIYSSILAEIRWRYLQMNTYRINDRSYDPDSEASMEWWDRRTFAHNIGMEYLESLSAAELLQNTAVREFRAVLDTRKGSEILRPTLYDLLAHRALQFMLSDDASYGSIGEARTLNSREALLYDARSFTALDIIPVEGPLHAALHIYQELLRFHSRDKQPYALVDADLERLKLVREKLNIPGKDSLYRKALIELRSLYKNEPVFTDISYHLAQDYVRTANQYDPPQQDENRYDIKKALSICEEAISTYPDAFHRQHCRQLVRQLLRPSLQLNIPEVVIPQTAFLGLIRYKNIEKIHYRLIPAEPARFRQHQQEMNSEDLIRHYLGQRFEKEGVFSFDDGGDHQAHRIETPFPALGQGFYLLLVMEADIQDTDSLPVAQLASFWVSDIAMLSKQDEDGSLRVMVNSRSSGEPLESAIVSVYFRSYDYRNRTYRERPGPVTTTDADGVAIIRAKGEGGNNEQAFISIRYNQDHWQSNDRFYLWTRRPSRPENEISTPIFTDRSVYRPGQTVFFKGILISKEEGEYSVLEDQDIEIILNDANGQRVSVLKLQTNDYGSFNGSIALPSAGLNGNYRLFTKHGGTSLRVDEYKRPRFEVKFEPVEGEYRVNDSVRLVGYARAYSGSTVGNAYVRYRVTRSVSYPWFPWRYHWIIPRPGEEEQIATGETYTDAQGQFKLSFRALPEAGGNRYGQAVYTYSVNVDVTDQSGEVREAQTRVRVGKTAFTLSMDIPGRIDKSRGHSYLIRALNHQGQAVETDVRIELFPIEEKERMIRNRLWSAPDQHYLGREDFIKRFPLDPYEEYRPEIKSGEPLRGYDVNTSEDSLVNLNALTGFPEGRYLLRLKAEDKFGQEVIWEKELELYVKMDGADVFKEQLWAELSAANAEPGEKLNLILSTAAPGLRVVIEVFNSDGLKDRQIEVLSNEKKILPIIVEESDEGGLIIQCVAIHQNRVLEKRFQLDVPRKGISMDVEFERFRDRLQPGNEEEWRIHFKGDDGSKVMPELLLGMYDASLDAIQGHSWNFRPYYPGPKATFWRTGEGFSLVSGRSYYPPYPGLMIPQRQYDKLDWQGLEFWYGGRRGPMMAFGAEMDAGIKKRARVNLLDDSDEAEVADMSAAPEEFGEAQEKAPAPEKDFVRRDLAETAFFMPELKAREDGGITVSFTVPEAVTRWNLLGLAHTRDLRVAGIRKSLTTAKDLMVMPNLPRHLHQGDEIILKCRVNNTSEKMLEGDGSLEIIDPVSGRELSDALISEVVREDFSIPAGEGSIISWKLVIPDNAPPLLQMVFKARSGNTADGEAHYLPVLSSKTLVTETQQIYLSGKGRKSIDFVLMKEGLESGLKAQKLSLEYTANPAWYVVKALPYLMDDDHRSASSVFNRFFANSIGRQIIRSNEEIAGIFKIWQEYQPAALWSELEKDQDLKSALLSETPWVRQAGTEREMRQRIGHYFNEEGIENALSAEWKKLMQLQSTDGGWPWFPGMRSNRHITADILSGMGFLMRASALEGSQEEHSAAVKGTRWLLKELIWQKQEIERTGGDYLKDYTPSSSVINILFATRMWMDEFVAGNEERSAWQYFYGRASDEWTGYPLMVQAILGELALMENDEHMSGSILASFRDRALYDEDSAMYWRDLQPGYRWYQDPVSSMARMITFFSYAEAKREEVDAMRTWLLKRKQVNHWGSTRGTALACEAFLSKGTNWLKAKPAFRITVGEEELSSKDPGISMEAGSGHFRKDWAPSEIKPGMHQITVYSENNHPSWGAAYFQYFEEKSKVMPHSEGLVLHRTIGQIATDSQGEVFTALGDKDELGPGDRVRVKLEIESSRDLDFVHLKDPRASLFEPADKISGTRYSAGMSWYLSISDAATHFFIEHLQAGTHIMEYDMFVTQEGSFSLGPATIQCHYAPDHAAHSGGMRLESE